MSAEGKMALGSEKEFATELLLISKKNDWSHITEPTKS